MEIMKETPWSRIRRQNSVHKEPQEIVGSGKRTGSVLKETSAVSVTIWISVQKRHSRILLRVLSCGRMREMLRKPEVQRQKSQWKNGSIALQGSPQRNVHQFILWKMAPSRVLVPQDQEWLQIWEKYSYAHRQVDGQPSKRSWKNGDKSAVAMLKQNEHHHRTGRLVMNVYSSNTRQLGCVFQDMEPPKSILRKSSDMQKPIQRVKFTKAVARHAKIRDQNPSLGMICPGDPHQRNPMSQNLRIGLRKRRNGKSDVPVKQRGGWPQAS